MSGINKTKGEIIINTDELTDDISYWIYEHHKLNKNMFEYSIYGKDISESELRQVIRKLEYEGFKVVELIDSRKYAYKTSSILIKWDINKLKENE